MKTIIPIGLWRLFVLLTLACALSPTDVLHAQDHPEPAILFTSDRDGHWDVYTMAADGSDVQILTPVTARIEGDIYEADLSPDGQILLVTVFRQWSDLDVSSRLVSGEIFAINLLTEDVTRITHSTANSQHPVWSPDGTQFSYLTGGFIDAFPRFHIVKWTSLAPLEFPATAFSVPGDGPYTFTSFDWSPDMQHIVLNAHSVMASTRQLVVFNSAGDIRLDRATPADMYTMSPRWSAEPDIIYFVGNNRKDICRFEVSAETYRCLTSLTDSFAGYQIENVDAARDGRLVFELMDFTTNQRDLLVYSFDGQLVNLTAANPASNKNPRWIHDYPIDPAAIDPLACAPGLPPRLSVGDQAYVIDLMTGGNIIRAGAGRTEERVGMAPVNSVLTILAGPVCADDLFWYQVQTADGLTGWTVEGEAGDYYLGPWPITATDENPE